MKAVGTLRFRLTALYLAFFSLLFILFSVFLYSLLGTSLRSRLDETLISEANTAAVMFQDELQEMKGNVELAASETVAGVRFRGLVAVAEGGRLLASTGPFPPDELQRIVAGAEGETVLVYYGAADKCIGVATANFEELVDEARKAGVTK